ncbi:Uncharacterised protein [Escherichia coli]|uniref:Uncharacterized protein n=1 Tax=Escherichia coli TaxID=562 RepID=A0A377B4M1_ECOLX|nr:Uncharacterised protein [Escherichia coli]
MPWRCRHTANPASCAFSIISGALIPGCEAAAQTLAAINYYSREGTLSRQQLAIHHTEPGRYAAVAAAAWSTRLADTAADGLRHFTAQQRLMPFQLQTIFITGQRPTDASTCRHPRGSHGRKLKRIFQYRVPHQNIAVQTRMAQL